MQVFLFFTIYIYIYIYMQQKERERCEHTQVVTAGAVVTEALFGDYPMDQIMLFLAVRLI